MKVIYPLLSAFVACAIFCSSCGDGKKDGTEQAGDSSNTATNSTSPAVEVLSKKKSLLRGLVGEHKLTSISGFMGANTMVDYAIEKGKWVATGSMIMEGEREGYAEELSPEVLAKLKSMKIVVGDDLSVKVVCNGKDYFNSSFSDTGMNFLLKKSPKDYESQLPATLNASATFIDDNLFIYAKDSFNETELADIDLVQVSANVVAISYNVKTKEFGLQMFYGDCCDNSTYIFK
jgi:hypothetical protein